MDLDIRRISNVYLSLARIERNVPDVLCLDPLYDLLHVLGDAAVTQ